MYFCANEFALALMMVYFLVMNSKRCNRFDGHRQSGLWHVTDIIIYLIKTFVIDKSNLVTIQQLAQ